MRHERSILLLSLLFFLACYDYFCVKILTIGSTMMLCITISVYSKAKSWPRIGYNDMSCHLNSYFLFESDRL